MVTGNVFAKTDQPEKCGPEATGSFA